MSEPVLQMGQYSIGPPGGPAFVYGFGTPVQVNNTSTDTGTMNVQDQAVVGEDGLVFGVDTMPGMVVTQTGQVLYPTSMPSVLDYYEQLAGYWNAPGIRLANGAVQVLRAWYPNSAVVRRCYGRGRKIMPTLGQVFQGLTPWTAQFQCSDGIWYADTEYSITLTMAPAYLGGLAPPWDPPMQLALASTTQSNVITNTGPQPTWPVITFTGPITNPSVSYQGTAYSVGWTGTLAAGQQLVIDSRPWARTAFIGGTTSAAGGLNGSQMALLQLPSGTTVAVMGGQDYTGTATCKVAWRNAHLSIGGSAV